jgi:hypothetical protein
MLTEWVTAAALFAAPTASDIVKPQNVRLAMAGALLLASGEKRYEPPEMIERVAPADAPVPDAGTLPAPVRTPLREEPGRESPAVLADAPRSEALPAQTGRQLLAQASPTNEDILRRLERLEEENRRLRQQQGQMPTNSIPAPTAMPAPVQRGSTPAQMIPGWRVSLYPWNAEGFITGDPIRVYNIPNERFTATLGQAPVDRTDRRLAREVRRFGHTNEMFIYKLEGWLQVKQAGQYQLGFEVNCGFGHPCNLLARIGDQQMFNHRHQKFENQLLFQGRTLPVGNYRVEVIFNIATNNFMRFAPERVSLYPQIRGPGEYNFRNFGPEELLTEANASIPSGAPRR